MEQFLQHGNESHEMQRNVDDTQPADITGNTGDTLGKLSNELLPQPSPKTEEEVQYPSSISADNSSSQSQCSFDHNGIDSDQVINSDILTDASVPLTEDKGKRSIDTVKLTKDQENLENSGECIGFSSCIAIKKENEPNLDGHSNPFRQLLQSSSDSDQDFFMTIETKANIIRIVEELSSEACSSKANSMQDEKKSSEEEKNLQTLNDISMLPIGSFEGGFSFQIVALATPEDTQNSEDSLMDSSSPHEVSEDQVQTGPLPDARSSTMKLYRAYLEGSRPYTSPTVPVLKKQKVNHRPVTRSMTAVFRAMQNSEMADISDVPAVPSNVPNVILTRSMVRHLEVAVPQQWEPATSSSTQQSHRNCLSSTHVQREVTIDRIHPMTTRSLTQKASNLQKGSIKDTGTMNGNDNESDATVSQLRSKHIGSSQNLTNDSTVKSSSKKINDVSSKSSYPKPPRDIHDNNFTKTGLRRSERIRSQLRNSSNV